MIYTLISLSYVIGGLALMIKSDTKPRLYLSIGFITLGVYYLLKSVFSSTDLELVSSIPLLIAALLFAAGPIIFLRGAKK